MEIKKLKDLCIGKGEYGIAASAEPFNKSKYRYLRITDISDDGSLLNSDLKSVSCPGCEKYILQENDIVFARTGNSTGRAFFYEPKYGELVYAGFLIKFHLDETKVNPKYLKYYTISQTYRNWVNNGPTGSTRGNMSEGDFANMPVVLPTRQQQDAIVDMFSPIDEKIENNNAICADLEGMAKLLYDYWFVQFDFPDESGNPYKSSGGKMVWNEELKREIPDGWETVIIGNISKAMRGVSYSGDNLANEGTPMLTLGCANKDGSFNINGIQSVQGIDDKNKYISPYDLVMYNTDMSALKHVIGRTILVPPLYEHCFSSHHITTIFFEDTQLKWLFYYLTQTEFFRKYIKGFATGTNVIGLDYRGVEDFSMAVPTQQVLNKFVQIVTYVEKIKGNLLKENVELSSLRDFLLPMLMNGQVKVKGA